MLEKKFWKFLLNFKNDHRTSEMTNIQFPNWFQNMTNCPVPYFRAYRIPTKYDAKLAESGIFFYLSILMRKSHNSDVLTH